MGWSLDILIGTCKYSLWFAVYKLSVLPYIHPDSVVQTIFDGPPEALTNLLIKKVSHLFILPHSQALPTCKRKIVLQVIESLVGPVNEARVFGNP